VFSGDGEGRWTGLDARRGRVCFEGGNATRFQDRVLGQGCRDKAIELGVLLLLLLSKRGVGTTEMRLWMSRPVSCSAVTVAA
jgi:hypothetical protein